MQYYMSLCSAVTTLATLVKVTNHHRCPKHKRSWRPLASVITTLHYVAVLSMGLSLMLRRLYLSSSSVVLRAFSVR